VNPDNERFFQAVLVLACITAVALIAAIACRV
jgi:hypothetical protein